MWIEKFHAPPMFKTNADQETQRINCNSVFLAFALYKIVQTFAYFRTIRIGKVTRPILCLFRLELLLLLNLLWLQNHES